MELEEYVETLDPRPLHADVARRRGGACFGYTELVARWVAACRAGARAWTIGAGVTGEPLWALRVGAERAARISVLMAGIHPIEWIGVEVLHALWARLVASPPADRAVIAFPVVNAGGYRRVEADLRADRKRWRRTNLAGVDLNRNWPTLFRARSRWWPGGWNRSGPHALSEPEVAAVAGALDRVAEGARIDIALSLHSIGRMILYPFGGRWRPPETRDTHRRAARAVKSRLRARYGVRQVSRWLPGAFVRGMEIDHLHGHYGATALLVECTLGGLRLGDPGTWMRPFCWYNPAEPGPAADDLARALEPFVRGRE